MTALTKDRKTTRKDGEIFAYPVAASATIYAGAMINLNSSGYAKAASDTAGEIFAGVAGSDQADNSSGSNGDLDVEGRRDGCFLMNASGMTIADAGADAFVVDDNTIGLGVVAQPTNITGVTVGRLPSTRGVSSASSNLVFTFSGTTLAFGGGTAVDISSDGEYVLTATDGNQIMVTVVAASIPGSDQNDDLNLRHVRLGVIAEYVSATQVYVDIQGGARR